MSESTETKTIDFFSRAGAEQLATAVREYWLIWGCEVRGRYPEVRVWLEEIDAHPGLYAVRSNLVNGLPAGWSAKTFKQKEAEIERNRRVSRR